MMPGSTASTTCSMSSRDAAIMVIPNALDDGGGITRWDQRYDYLFFEDLLAELDELIVYDDNRLFLTGHSNGAVMANELRLPIWPYRSRNRAGRRRHRGRRNVSVVWPRY